MLDIFRPRQRRLPTLAEALAERANPTNRTAPAPNTVVVETDSYRVYSVASKAPGAPGLSTTGIYAHELDGFPIDGDRGPINYPGAGVTVVDCPLGFRGELLLDDRPHLIYPGARIPERYSSVNLRGLAQRFTANQLYADSPIVLALGARALEYRRPGMRVHYFDTDTMNVVNNPIAPNVRNAFSDAIWCEGYDWIVVCMAPGHTVDPTRFRSEVQFTWPPMIGASSQFMPPIQGGVNITTPLGEATKLIPVFGANMTGEGAAGVRGFWQEDFNLAPATPANWLIPVGRGAQKLQIRYFNTNLSADSINTPGTTRAWAGFWRND